MTVNARVVESALGQELERELESRPCRAFWARSGVWLLFRLQWGCV